MKPPRVAPHAPPSAPRRSSASVAARRLVAQRVARDSGRCRTYRFARAPARCSSASAAIAFRRCSRKLRGSDAPADARRAVGPPPPVTPPGADPDVGHGHAGPSRAGAGTRRAPGRTRRRGPTSPSEGDGAPRPRTSAPRRPATDAGTTERRRRQAADERVARLCDEPHGAAVAPGGRPLPSSAAMGAGCIGDGTPATAAALARQPAPAPDRRRARVISAVACALGRRPTCSSSSRPSRSTGPVDADRSGCRRVRALHASAPSWYATGAHARDARRRASSWLRSGRPATDADRRFVVRAARARRAADVPAAGSSRCRSSRSRSLSSDVAVREGGRGDDLPRGAGRPAPRTTSSPSGSRARPSRSRSSSPTRRRTTRLARHRPAAAADLAAVLGRPDRHARARSRSGARSTTRPTSIAPIALRRRRSRSSSGSSRRSSRRWR